MAERFGVHQAARKTGLTTTFLYTSAARQLIPSTVAGGKLYFDPVELKAFQQEEVLRRARRETEKRAAAERLRELLEKRRRARKP
jgi:hypothetical protein